MKDIHFGVEDAYVVVEAELAGTDISIEVWSGACAGMGGTHIRFLEPLILSLAVVYDKSPLQTGTISVASSATAAAAGSARTSCTAWDKSISTSMFQPILPVPENRVLTTGSIVSLARSGVGGTRCSSTRAADAV